MYNDTFKKRCAQIDSFTVAQLKKYIKIVQKDKDDYPDADDEGDIAVTLLENRARSRLKELEIK
jgi:hypothetical protein